MTLEGARLLELHSSASVASGMSHFYDDINELVERHEDEVSTEKLKEPQTMQYTKILQEISSEEEAE